MSALNDFLNRMDWQSLGDFLLSLLAVLLCLTVHEASHGLAAYALGDPTAKNRDRLSLNPLRHIDPLGLIMMILLGFGWAKPVPVDRRYFRDPRLGMALTAAAGPVSNFLLAYLALLLRAALFPLGQLGNGLAEGACDALVTLALMSIGLGLFNLIPVPPLDGSRVLEGIFGSLGGLGEREWLGTLLMLAVLFSDKVQLVLTAVRNLIFSGMVDGTLWLYHLMWNFLG